MNCADTLAEATKIIEDGADAFQARHTIKRHDSYDWMGNHAAYAKHQNMLRVLAKLKHMERHRRERTFRIINRLLTALFFAAVLVLLVGFAITEPIEPDRPGALASTANLEQK